MEGKQTVPTQPFKPPTADTTVDTSPSQPRTNAKSPKSVPKECPLCKVELKNDPPNFNTCTECKAIVCNLCGFNPTPHKTEVKEWLCLTCQMQRASTSSHVEPQEQAKKVPPVPKKEAPPVSLQKKENPDDATNTGQKTALGKKEPTDTPTKQPSQQMKSGRPQEKEPAPPPKAEHPQDESGFFGFGFGGARSRSPSPQPPVSAVSGKVLGFGSSFLSTASNLISSAIQDEPSTAPPTSRKGSSISETTSPASSRKGSSVSVKSNATPPSSRKGSEAIHDSQKAQPTKDTKPSISQKQDEKKLENKPLIQQTKELSNNVKDDKLVTPKALSEPLHKLCPLCKEDLKRDQYNSCTECKNTVCNLCGFNPTPHESKVKWLCLACQMQKPTEPTPLHPQPPTKEVAPPEINNLYTSQKKPASIQRKSEAEQENNKQTLTKTDQPTEKEMIQPHQVALSESQKTEPQNKSAFFGFGFGGARSRSPSPAGSAVSGKVLGFGSSIINSASNLISSAVQDESSTTPSGSRKASVVSQMSDKTPPTSRKGSAVSQTSVKTTHPTSQNVSEAALNTKGIQYTNETKPEFEFAEKKEETTVERQVKGSTTDQLIKNVGVKEDQSKQDGAAHVSSESHEESGFFGFGTSQSPLHLPTASAVSGKVLGFGSSIFSSASNLISTAPGETTTTPPTSRKGSVSSQLSSKSSPPPSRKGSSVSQTSDKITTPPSSRKGSVISQTSIKTNTPLTSRKESKAIEVSPKTQFSDDKTVHPVNIQEKVKTEDKKSEVSQTQPTTPLVIKDTPPKATKTESTKSLPETCPLCMVDLKKDPPNYDTCTECKNTVCNLCGFNPMPNQAEKKQWLCLNCQMQRAQVEANKVPLPASQQKKTLGSTATEKDQTFSAAVTPGSKKPSAVPPTQKSPQQQDNIISAKSTPTKTGSNKEEAGFFGFGRSRSPSPQPVVSNVSGKVLGFGSSLLSSATNLISTAVQDESSTTRLATQEMSTASQTSVKTTLAPSTSEKRSADLPHIQGVNSEKQKEKKPEMMIVQGNVLPKEDEQKSEPPKTCPLCKADIFKNPPNYYTCTSCKSTVCNLCGFNPMPHQTEASEWLCLNCQMQRAPEPPHLQAGPQATKIPTPALPQKQAPPIPSQGKPGVLTENQNLAASGKQEGKSNLSDSKPPLIASNKLETQMYKTDAKSDQPSNPSKEDSRRSRSPSPQPAVSAVSDKVLGFGSSFLSSAQSLISSAVQDETSKTPPTSRKGSTCSQTSNKIMPTPPTSRKGSVTTQDLKPESKTASPTNTVTNLISAEKTSDPQTVKPPQAPVKEEPLKNCPLCKENLKENPQNYNSCTSCKSKFCNLCGFNPNPHQTEVKEWLCLTCQMQKMPGPPPCNPQPQSDKIPPPASPHKKDSQFPPSPEKSANVLAEKDKKPPVSTKKPTMAPTSPKVQMSKGDASPSKSAPPPKGVQTKEESSFFGFGFGGARSRSPSPQPAVSEKVLGFGSSFLSSASNLISSAVQDESSIKTPETSRKGSTVSQTSEKHVLTPPTSRKVSLAPQDSKQKAPAGESKPLTAPPQEQNRPVEKTIDPQLAKLPHASYEPPKACPLCKEVLKNDPKNYSSCTSCKIIVCNLCGFNPHQTEVEEWLCLTCQIQKVSEPPPAQHPPQSNKPPPASPQKKETPIPPSEKNPSVHTEQDKKPSSETKTPMLTQTTANAEKSNSDVSPFKSGAPPKGEQIKEESGFFGFGFGGARSRSPSPQSTVSGKVLGFGSSFLSSASNLISSAVQEDSSTKTPPNSRKGSTVSQSSVKTTPTPPISRKGSEALQTSQKITHTEEAKRTAAQKPDEKKMQEITDETKSQDEMPKVPVADVKSIKSVPEPLKACPICKVDLKSDPQNYNTCSDCKNTVCNCCGFNPMPHQTEVKEWLCLNCQMKRAPVSTSAEPGPLVNKEPPPTIQQKKEAPIPTPVPVSSQGKLNVIEKDKTIAAGDNPGQKSSQHTTTVTTKPTEMAQRDASPTISAVPKKHKPSNEESGLFSLGFGGPRSGSPQPSVTAVSGKVFGFGSSILNSASSLISSAVQDESSTTPPSSRKASTISETSVKTTTPPASRRDSIVSQTSVKTTPTPPASRKGSFAHQTSPKLPHTDDSKISVTDKPKEDKLAEKEMQQTTTSEAWTATKAPTKACPLCKVDLNVGSQDISNYSTCTECKNVVCNLCGFNPTPHQTEVNEWLCLNCQTQRALNGMGQQGPAKLKSNEQPENVTVSAPPLITVAPSLVSTKVAPDVIETQKKDVNQVQPETKIPKQNEVQAKIINEKGTPVSEDIQKEPSLASPKLVESIINPQPASSEKKEISNPKEPNKEIELEKSSSKSNSAPQPEPAKQESSFFGFGFGGPKPQPTSKPSESTTGKRFGFGGLTETARSRSPSPQTVSAVSGKVLGFGSSIFSSASNLISSAVQDESSTTPPTSRKGSAVSQTTVKTTPPTSRKGSTIAPDTIVSSVGEIKPQAAQKHDEGKPEIKPVSAPQLPQKPVQKSCPLCKVELNLGSKDAKNLNMCTECKVTVCSQCGFNPMPHQTEVKEWLCLNCQVKRAQTGTNTSENTQSFPLVKDYQTPSKIDKVPTVEPNPDEQSNTAAAEKKVSPTKNINEDVLVPGPQQESFPDANATQSVISNKELPKKNNPQPEPAETPPLATKDTPSPAKSAPCPQTEPPKQESSFFGFGLGGSKPSESTTGKFFGFGGLTETARSRSPSPQSVSAVSGKVLGFGSSLFSSASTLISSAGQDDSSKTPPTSRKGSSESSPTPTARKGSVTSQSSTKGTPPTSRKGSVATQDYNKTSPPKEIKVPIEKNPEEKKPEKLDKAKVSNLTEENDKPETKQDKIIKHFENKTQLAASICPLCNIKLNMGTKDPPNYNSCTECKIVVCQLCGFNPMPHLAEAEWLCLNCQTQRALAGQLEDLASTITKPTVTPKTELVKTPVTAPAPQPSPDKQVEQMQTAPTSAAEVMISSVPAPSVASITNVASTINQQSILAPVPIADIKVKVDTALKSMLLPATAVEERNGMAPIQTAESQKSVSSGAEVILKETGKNIEAPGEKQPVPGSVLIHSPLPTGTDKEKVKDITETTAVLIDEQKDSVVIQMDTSLPKISEIAEVETLKVVDIKDQEGQDILSVSAESYSSAEEELKEIQRVGEISIKETDTKLLPAKSPDTIKQYNEDSSGSESSPQIQRRRVRPASSSSEEYINSGDDEEFIRRQLMHMGEDKSFVLSDEENQIIEDVSEKVLQTQQETREVKHGDEKKPKRVLKKLSVEPEEWSDNSLYSYVQENQFAQVIPILEALEETRVEIDVSDDNEKIPSADFDATAAANVQKSPIRQITEDYESLIEDSSKGNGSSSVQVSSITPGTASPTSVSSIDEDSDSSPSHKKARAESKQQRRPKHRPQGQAPPTVEDSSEDDKVREKNYQLMEEAGDVVQQQLRKVTKKSKTERVDGAVQRRRDHLTKTDKLQHVSGMSEHKSSSFSDLSPSFESEPESDQWEYRTLSSETHERHDVGKKPLKSAEEAYEDMMQKAQENKTLEKCTPPDIEPLYGGMLIEDYAYDTLVEEHEQTVPAICTVTQDQDLRKVSESVRILMAPEEAYEEMMQKSRDIFQKEQEAKQVEETELSTFLPLDVSDTCYVNISGIDALTTDSTEKPLLQAEDAYDDLLNKQKDVLTPGTSPTQSSPISPASPLSVSESSYESPEVIFIPSSGEEDVADEPIECILEPYITESTQDVSEMKALYPIPDLKITQCSSGEEEVDEEDSFKQEIISEPTDDTLKEAGEIAEPEASEESFQGDSISIICEIPSPKHEAAETLPVCDSRISPLSPPTSPGVSSPDSYIESTIAPPSSPSSGQTPEPTTPASPSIVEISSPVVIHMPDVSEQDTSPETVSLVSSTQLIVSPLPVTSTPPCVSEIAATPEDPVSKRILGPKPIPAPKPKKTIQETIQNKTYDLASQELDEKAWTIDMFEPTPDSKSATIEKQKVAPATDSQLEQNKTLISSHSTVTVSVAAPSEPAFFITTTAATSIIQSQETHFIQTSVVAQMPTQVTASSQSPHPAACQERSLAYAPVSATVSAVDQVAISVPSIASASVPGMVVSMARTSCVQTPDQNSKESKSESAPPPGKAPPISPLAGHIEPIAAKTVSIVSPTSTTTIAFGASLSEPVSTNFRSSASGCGNSAEACPDDASATVFQLQPVSQIISPAVQTQQGKVVVVLPNFENVSTINQTAQDVIVNSKEVKTTTGDGRGHPVIVSVSPLTCTAIAPPSSGAILATASVTDSTVPLTVKKPTVIAVSQERTDKPVIEFPPPPTVSPPELPFSTVPKLDLNQLKTVCTSSSVTATLPESPQTVTPTHKSPPPVPPKPVCIPPGLVFNHRARESVKPPTSPEPVIVHAVRAATLPRTKEPPNALSLSLTAPVNCKHSSSSPKSPMSPRFARTLETYVVITLPSEPGSPVESITTQAPTRRSSLPTPRQQVPGDAPQMFAPAVVDAPVTALSEQIIAAPPEVTLVPPTAAKPIAQNILAPCITVPAAPVSGLQTVFSEPFEVVSRSVAQTMTVPRVTVENKMQSTSALFTTTYDSTIAQPAMISAPVVTPPPPMFSAPVSIAPPEMVFAPAEIAPPAMVSTSVDIATPAMVSASTVAAAPHVPMEPTAFSAPAYTAPTMVSQFPAASASVVLTTKPSKEVMVAPLSEPFAQYAMKEVRQEPEIQHMQTTYSAPITITQIPIPTQNKGMDVEEVLIISAAEDALNGLGSITQFQEQHKVYEQKQEPQALYSAAAVTSIPATFSQFSKSIESQEICGQEKVVSSMSQVYSAVSKTEQHPEKLPKLVTQVVTTEVQRTTTVSVVQERIPIEPIPEPMSAPVVIQPEVHPKPKQNERVHYPSDVIDLTKFKVNVTMTDQGMDLTAPDLSKSSLSSESSDKRQATAVQPEIVNLSAEIIPTTTLSFVTDSITIVTCSATIAYTNNSIVEKPLDLGNATSVPLPLTTYSPFVPLAQIVYRPVNSQPKPITCAEIPVNLSYRAAGTTPPLLPVTVAPSFTNGTVGIPMHLEPSATGPVDLTTSKPLRTMVALSSSSGVVTTVVEDNGTPVDLTSGRQTVCCDVIYKLPFTGSCRTQPPVITHPDNQSDFREDQYHNATTPVIEDLSTMKVSVSDSNFKETELIDYTRKNGFTYKNGASEGAVDLTSSKLSSDEALDYSKKGTLAFAGITAAPLSEGTSFGMNSLLRSSNGIVYSSVGAPVPSTYAVTTQPGSIFSTTYNSQNQHTPYDFIHTTGTDQSIFPQFDISKDSLPSALASLLPSLTVFPELYSDATLEAIAASLDTLVSPNFPDLDDSKSQQYKAEHEFLQLEKLKQLCLAEELEWERQEIQRYREQEQFIVQKELEELQNMKQHLLMHQEEERKAHIILQQETFAQQQVQLEQIHRLQQQLQQQLEEQKVYPYGFGPNEGKSPPTSSDIILESKYSGEDNGQYLPVKDENSMSSAVTVNDTTLGHNWPTTTSGAFTQYDSNIPMSVSAQTKEQMQISTNLPDTAKQHQNVDFNEKKFIESGVQTDDEDGVERIPPGRRRRCKRSTDSCAQTDDEDQDEWDVPVRSRRRSRSSRYADGEKGKSSKVSSIAIQTVAEISVQTEHSGTIRRSPVRAQVDTKVNFHRDGQTESDSDITSDKDKRRSVSTETSVSTHLIADNVGVTKSPKVLCSPHSPVSPGKSAQKMLTAESSKHLSSPRSLQTSQRSLCDPKSHSSTTEDRMMYHYSDTYSTKSSQSATPVGSQKKVKRTLPHPPPEEDTIIGLSGYTSGSARRRMCRNTTMARAKILQDIDKELDLVERESSKLRKIQAELDEEEKEIDAKLRYLEMGINRRKEALLKEREKRERAYLQGVAEERDYMSDSEVSNIREARGNGHGLERPRTAPQSELDQFIPPQSEAESQYASLTSPYSHYQYASQSQTPGQYPQKNLYQQSLYHQQVSPYQSIYSSVPSLNQQSQQTGYDHSSLLLMQQKPRQTTLSDLEPKITTNYEVVRNQPILIVPTSTESAYGVSHLGGKYSNLDLRMGLEERASMASSPMSSISAESFYADLDHHNARNYVLIDDIGELTKGSSSLGSSFSIADKDIGKAERLLRTADVRRAADVADFLGPLQAASRLHSYGKAEDDSMEEPYELKMLKQQIKHEFRRGTESLEQLAGLPHYLHSDTSLRHFPKAEKYSIGRLTLEKQAAKQLPASVLYQKQLKNKKALIDPKIIKFSPIQESRDLELDYSNFLASASSSVGGLSARARLLQDEITFGLRKNLVEQQKYLGSALGANLAQSLNFGQSVHLGPTIRSSIHEDGTYPSGNRSRPSSRPSSVYGLDLSIKTDLSNSSLRLKTEGEGMDSQFVSARAKPTSLPISQSRGRIPIVAQNSEEESPLSPVGQPMGMARASAGPLPPISADSRDQYGSSHSLPEVQQHMREESRTSGYERDIGFIKDDLQGAMSDSEAGGPSWNVKAYHLQHEETDWFDKPRRGGPEAFQGLDRRQVKGSHYLFPHTRIKLQRDPKDHTVSGSGLGIRVVGGKEIPGTNREIGAYIARVSAGGSAEQSGKLVEGMQVLEWNGISLLGKTYEEVQSIVGQQCGETEICVRLDLNMLSDIEHPQQLDLHTQLKAGERQRSPGVDPKQLAAELQKVSQQQAPTSVLSALERAAHLHSATGSGASSGVPSPGQPGSPSVSKKRHSSKSSEALKSQPHPITGEIQLQINYDKNMGNLIVHVLQARNLAPRENNGYTDPFVKVYLLPGRGQVMVVQNASAENKRRTKYIQKTQNPEWNQTVIYKNIHLEQLKKKTLEVTVWDYDRYSSNDFLGEVLIDLSNTSQLDNTPRWHPLKEQSESIQHGRAPPPQGPGGSGGLGGQGGPGGHGGPGGPGGSGGQGGQPGNQESPKTSVIKSRSHGIFPDPAKDTQVSTIEKSHSSPGSSKSSSEGHLRSHGPSRSQSKGSITQAHLEEAGNAIAAAEAAVHQARFQPNKTNHRMADGVEYTLESEDGTGPNALDSAIFQVPQLKNIPNGTDKCRGLESVNLSDSEGKMMGEIKVALKKEMKTEGEQLVLEVLQCRNITYKFKSPDHLPDLYVKLYVVNVATQKKIIKKKTRVCRHDREPSFNETFRFNLNPVGHSIQLFLVSNGGKFVKKTLIGEAYIWLDKVDMRKRAVSWHKLVATTNQTQP
nr:LOW QUALITY PROTEIN: protein piccolo-like [Misgurnus anguillicaudatus]